MNAATRRSEALTGAERTVLTFYLVSALAVFVLMMLVGLWMRAGQAGWLEVPITLFYQLMTAHGAAMVGTTALASVAVMWYFLRQYVPLRLGMFTANYVLFMLGAVAILASVFLGGYAGGWTFLYPLPVHSMNTWSTNAAALFMVGYLLIGVGFLLFYLDALLGIIRTYGNLGRGLGLQWLFGGAIDKTHPPTVVASSMVIIVNSLGILAGAIVLVISLVNAYVPSFAPNPLLAKNLIYMFGHVFINATIYMAVIAVYELLPRYTGRPWGVSRPFLWAWAAATAMVLTVYPHHLLMDYAMPPWMLIMGQVISYTSGLPVFAVTAYGGLTNLYRSGIRWSVPAMLLTLSLFGWAAGIIPAIIDGTIGVNQVMHNTMWVPGHFHFYLLLGVLPMVLGFMHYVIDGGAQAPSRGGSGVATYVVGGLLFVGAFLAGGHASVPRRYAAHLPAWMPYDRVATVGAALVIAAMLLFTVRIIAGLTRASGHVATAPNAGA